MIQLLKQLSVAIDPIFHQKLKKNTFQVFLFRCKIKIYVKMVIFRKASGNNVHNNLVNRFFLQDDQKYGKTLAVIQVVVHTKQKNIY